MRVISGKLKGIRFSPPKGFPSRPTTDFAKEGLFNFLGNRLNFEDIEVLDLFVGTGNISFEFASRGTKQVISVDRNYKCIQFINSMISKHNLNNISTTKMEVTSFIKGTNSQFDLVFADPPFDYLEYHNLIKDVFENSILKSDGNLIIEHNVKTNLSDQINYVMTKKYGNVVFSLFHK